VAKEWGAKGLAYIVYGGRRRGALTDREVPVEQELAAFGCPAGSTVLSAPATPSWWRASSAGMRLHVARELGLQSPTENVFHWVIDFPLFERDEDTGQWTFLHHPFTRRSRATRTSRATRARRRASTTT
jgi:aspartyl-tRNA synthetase